MSPGPAPLTSDRLARLERIRHGFFTRAGGVSQGVYASLNCGLGSDDEPVHVRTNLARVAAAFEATPADLSTVSQVHGCTVLTLRRAHAGRPEADALVTTTPGVVLGITGADCPSVLLADERAGVIGAAHAGWRGALGGVLEAVVGAMCAAGASRAALCAAVGPGIQQASYEVGAELRGDFVAADDANARFFAPRPAAAKFLFDLPGYIESRLAGMQVSRIERLACDTLSDEQRFFSYRRATLAGEPDYGRQLAAISLR